MSLKRIRVGPGFIGPHAGANLAIFLKRFHHLFAMFPRIYRAKTRKNIQVILTEMHPVIVKSNCSMAVFMPAENSIGFRNPNDALNRRQRRNLVAIDFGCIADQVNFSELLLLTFNNMFLQAYVWQVR
jgi:hypothetical protein